MTNQNSITFADLPLSVVNEVPREELPSTVSLLTHPEFILSMTALLTAIVLTLMLLRSLKHHEAPAEVVTRTILILVIVLGTIVLISAGYSNDQIAPAFGLFGTICGYLLGREQAYRKEGSDAAFKP